MIIIREPQFKFLPLIDVANGDSINELSDLIVEYIIENKHRAIVKGKERSVFYASGLAEYHHEQLARYLNEHIFRQGNIQCRRVGGQFADYPMTHSWILAGELIIDLAIRQFYDKEIDLPDEFLRPQLDCHCFICDNAQNPIYQLYQLDQK